MIIIDAAKSQIDQQALDALLDQYDRAGQQKREQIAGDIEAVIGPAVRSMLASNLGGLGLGPEDLESLKTEVVQQAVRESGLTRYRRQDIVPETLVERMRTTQQGQRLWELLTPDLQQELASAQYVKADLSQRLTDEISQLLRMPNLGTRLGIRADVITSMVERTSANAQLLHSLYPDSIAEAQRPERSILGFVKTHLPELRRRLLKEKDPGVTPAMRSDWAQISRLVESLRGAGHQPTPGEVYEQYRADLEQRTRPARDWMEGQVRKLQPHNAFQINSAVDLRAVRELLDEAGVDPALWREPGAPYYMAKREAKPLGRKNVERLMATPGLGAPASPSAERMLPTAPAATQQGEVPDWTPLYRMVGSRERLQSAIIDHIYGGPQHEAERQVALFLVDHPRPQPNQVEQFIDRLRPDIAEDIRGIGWDVIAKEVDDSIKDLLRSPDAIDEIAAELGLSSGTGQRTAEAIRRQIFVRSVKRTVRVVRAGSAPKITIPAWADSKLDDRGRLYLAVADLILGRRLGLRTFQTLGQYIAGNPRPTDEQIREFLDALPIDEADKIRTIGWSNAVRLTDDLVMAYLGQPDIRRELREMLGLDPEREAAAVGAVRQMAMGRSLGLRRAS